MNRLLLHCRPGFEGEVCAELAEQAARVGVIGEPRGTPGSAMAEFVRREAAAVRR